MTAARIRIDESDLEDINQESELYRRAARELNEAKTPEATAYREYAIDRLNRDSVIEFDDDAVVSTGFDGGAYVMGWIWVNRSELEEDGYLDEHD